MPNPNHRLDSAYCQKKIPLISAFFIPHVCAESKRSFMCDTVYMPVHTQRICSNITGTIGMASRRILLSRRQQLSRIPHGRMRLRWIPRQPWWNPARLSNKLYDDRRRVCCRNKKRNIFIFWWMECHPNMPCGGWYWHGNTRHKIYLRKRNKPGQRNCNRNLVWL